MDVLVVGSTSMLPVWASESAIYLGEKACLWMAHTDKQGTWSDAADSLADWLAADVPSGVTVRLVGLTYQSALNADVYEVVHRRAWGQEWALVVYDEVHKLKSLEAKQHKAWRCVPAQFRLGLSGTPAPNDDMDYVGVMRITAPFLLRQSDAELVQKLSGGGEPKIYPAKPKVLRDGSIGRQIVGDYGLRKGHVVMCRVKTRDGIQEEMVEIIYQMESAYTEGDWCLAVSADDDAELRLPRAEGVCAEEREWLMGEIGKATFMARREDSALSLPSCTISHRYFVLAGECEGRYLELDAELETVAADGSIVSSKNQMVNVQKLERVCCGIISNDDGDLVSADTTAARKKVATEWITEIDADEPLVIFCKYHSCLDQIREVAANLNHSVSELSGRKNELARWQAGDTKILVAQVSVGSLSVSLVRACYGLIYSADWSAANDAQMIARLDRPGQTRPVHITKLEAMLSDGKPTMDGIKYLRVASKQARQTDSRVLMAV